MSKFIGQALKGEPITIYGDGSQTRTFCFVTDNIEVSIKALTDNLFVNDVINIGGDAVISILDLAQLIIRLTNSTSEIQFLPPLKDGDMTRRQPDNSKMKSVLGKELITVEEGIKKLLENENFIRKLG